MNFREKSNTYRISEEEVEDAKIKFQCYLDIIKENFEETQINVENKKLAIKIIQLQII
jgi:hypothetical protein